MTACAGHIEASSLTAQRNYRAMCIVYADQERRVPGDHPWPDWCTDIPMRGSVVNGGDPLCTVWANADTEAATLQLLQQRRADIQRAIFSSASSC
ncbi:MAG: hypothetical protein MI673_09765 [Thiotrichales bacterium]|nr:hypothetical protein [Thiotrichales bacterium]